ncbi:MAG: GMC family oxidoreductase N-terminal domain-containing protein [Pseudomonadota bacterium]
MARPKAMPRAILFGEPCRRRRHRANFRYWFRDATSLAEVSDFIVIGAGSAGCAVGHGLATHSDATVCVLEAGRSDAVPQVKVPFGLLYTMGSGRDWRFKSTAQTDANRRELSINRGKMLGGSSSINSMVWFRGRMDDFDQWDVPGWAWSDVSPDFEEVEQLISPMRHPDPHPLAEAFGRTLGSNGHAPPTPERESAGVFDANMRNGRRWSAADAFLRPAERTGRLKVVTAATIDRVECDDGQANRVRLADGRIFQARRGIVVSAGSIGSPAILLRSGIGPGSALKKLGIEVIADLPGVGQNLHDHPAVGLHHQGPKSGYGLTLDQAPAWIASPVHWALRRKGRMTSNFVEAGAFFRAAPVGPDGDDRPDVQTHFIPYMMGYRGRTIIAGSGYFADVCVCRPVSRGALTLASADPQVSPNIDLGVLRDEADLAVLVAGLKRLRQILASAPFGDRTAPEVFPGPDVTSDRDLAGYARDRCGTAYHPVGTVRMGADDAPLTPGLAVRGIRNLWVADASIMPRITSANTNAPSMMIGHRAAKLIIRSEQ